MTPISHEQYIQTQHGQLYSKCWQVEGSLKAPIILIHDSLGCVALWRDFPAQLAQVTQRNVIAYDRLGFGQSSVHPKSLALDFVVTEATQDFSAVLKAFNIQAFVVLGHSVGGGMAVACAANYPKQCVALITEAAQAFNEAQTQAGIQAAQKNFQDPEQVARLAKYHADKANWVLDAWIKTWLSDGFRTWHLDEEAKKVQVPSLILHGEYDEYGSKAHPERFASQIGEQAIMKIVAGCHHVPHKEQPDYILKTIQDFLAHIA